MLFRADGLRLPGGLDLRAPTVVLALVLVALFAAPVGAPAVGLSAPGMGPNDWRDEPDVLAAGCLPYTHDDPAACYPADSNGFGASQDGLPRQVLQAKFGTYAWPATVVGGTWSGLGVAGVFNPDTDRLLADFKDGRHVLPGPYSAHAFLGTWNDLDGDGFRDEAGQWRNSVGSHDRDVYLTVASDDECVQQEPSVDPSGSTHVLGGEPGNLAPAVVLPVGVRWACTSADEWTPPDGWPENAMQVVGYLAPKAGDLGRTILAPSPEVHATCHIIFFHCFDERSARAPDLLFEPSDFYGEGTYSWEGVYEVSPDGSLLHTLALTVIASPVISSDGPLTHTAGPDSLVDVDVFRAVDPAVEQTYHTTLFDLAAPAANDAYAEVRPHYDAVAEVLCDFLCWPSDQATQGYVISRFLGPERDFPDGRNATDYAEPHLYLNLRVAESFHADFVATAFVGGMWGTVDPVVPGTYDTGQYCPDLDAEGCGHVARLQVDGFFGVWHDLNGDGFVGSPPRDYCPDAYRCGRTQDPNEDLYTFGPTKEWTPQAVDGPVYVEVRTTSGRWGPVGAYLVGDDDRRPDGTIHERPSSLGPYDDAVEDVFDGRIDKLVTEGPIRLVLATTWDGYYYSSEDIVVPGLQATEGVHLRSDAFSLTAERSGLPEDESVRDSDDLTPWSL